MQNDIDLLIEELPEEYFDSCADEINFWEDEEEASEENDAKLEFANAIALDYEFDG